MTTTQRLMWTFQLRPLVLAVLITHALVGCQPNDNGGNVDSGGPDACDGLGCFIVDCNAKGLPLTTVSGTVHAPNGTLPLYGVNVYVPASPPGALPDGASCDRCTAGALGGAFTQTTTDEAGHFTLTNVPATTNVPLIIQVGKWRRQLVLPNVAACEELPLLPDATRLPKNTTEGDLPKIAISTGAADALECLIRKLGIDDREITTSSQPGKVHLYSNTSLGLTGGQGTNLFAAGFAGGTGAFSDSQQLWNSLDNMKRYDILMLSCEGDQYPGTKSQPALESLEDFADFGGRAFLSHWHNIWIEGATRPGGSGQSVPAWQSIATWNDSLTTFAENDTIDETANPKGVQFATWMLNVGGSTTRDQIPITGGKQTVTSVDPAKAQRWVYWESGGIQYPQNFQFTTPNNLPEDQRCGRVVFSDMHVASGSTSAPDGTGYPSLCSTLPLTPQEKALAFMFFDISSCVGPIL